MVKTEKEKGKHAADVTESKRQRRLIFKRRRGGVVLTREQVKAIKLGRKQIRKEMKARGIKSREDFNLTAASLGLYFDKSRGLLLWQWLFHGMGIWALLGAALALLGVTFLYSSVTQLRGHFTINMSDGMFREGFVLSEHEDFREPTTHLFCEPALDVPCISISHIPDDIDDYEGQHNEHYFAYTFFIRNEGESTVDYDWAIQLNSESLDLSKACWVMVFEDGEMLFYAEPNASGEAEALPARGDDGRGYVMAPLIEQNAQPDSQYEVIAQQGNLTFYRVIPIPYVSDTMVAMGTQTEVEPMEVHKYTIVIWLEGDDPDCTNDLIGGHAGMEVFMKLCGEETESSSGEGGVRSWENFWKGLKFWKD